MAIKALEDDISRAIQGSFQLLRHGVCMMVKLKKEELQQGNRFCSLCRLNKQKVPAIWRGNSILYCSSCHKAEVMLAKERAVYNVPGELC